MSRHRARVQLRVRVAGSFLALLLCAVPLVSATQAASATSSATTSPATSVSAAHEAHHRGVHHGTKKHKHKHTKHTKHTKHKKKHHQHKKHTTTSSKAGGAGAVSAAGVLATGAAKPATGFVGSSNVFGVDVRQASLNSDSAAIVANLAHQVTSHWNGVAAFNAWSYNTSFFVAAAGTPRQQMKFYDCQGKGHTPSVLHNAQGTGAFDSVPIPANAVAALGTDKEMSIWSPSTDQLWEFWVAEKRPDGWYACWGGRIDHWSTSAGVFANGTGSSATGIALAAGNVGLAEATTGTINHAISLTVVDAESGNLFSYPAQRSDGYNPTNAAHAVREGMRFRLDPTVNVDALSLTPVAKAVARAAQTYGFIVVDKGGAVALTGESGVGVQAATGVDPWQAITRGVASYNVLANFPWSRLQALPFDYGKP